MARQGQYGDLLDIIRESFRLLDFRDVSDEAGRFLSLLQPELRQRSDRGRSDAFGHAVRFGVASDVLAAREGIETVLSLREVMPDLPLAACLSSAHLAAMTFPPTLRRLYVLRDDDPAGDHAVATLMARTQEVGIECLVLSPRLADFNYDLRYLGRGAMRAILHPQLAPQDVARFLQPVTH